MTARWRGTLLVALGWTIVGGAIALVGLRDVDDGARLLVVGATVTGPLLAVGAAVLLARQRRRGAGGLLVLSSLVTPTYAAWVLNLVPLVVGGGLDLGTARPGQGIRRAR